MPFHRRAQMSAIAATLGLIGLAVNNTAQAETRTFEVIREGMPIGTHTVRLKRDGDTVRAETAIDLSVKIAFIPVYTYTHRNVEIWRNERLTSLETVTNDNGQELRVEARAVGNILHVAGPAGAFAAPADTVPTSYWSRAVVTGRPLLDTQNGKLLDVDIVAERSKPTLRPSDRLKKYMIQGDLNVQIWYDEDDDWRKLAFDYDGARFEYRLIGRGP